jgi:hypothetical protein
MPRGYGRYAASPMRGKHAANHHSRRKYYTYHPEAFLPTHMVNQWPCDCAHGLDEAEVVEAAVFMSGSGDDISRRRSVVLVRVLHRGALRRRQVFWNRDRGCTKVMTIRGTTATFRRSQLST